MAKHGKRQRNDEDPMPEAPVLNHLPEGAVLTDKLQLEPIIKAAASKKREVWLLQLPKAVSELLRSYLTSAVLRVHLSQPRNMAAWGSMGTTVRHAGVHVLHR